MFQFTREKILPLFLQKKISIGELAKSAGVNYSSALKAVNGQPISAPIVAKIAAALGINALEYLEKN